MDVGNTFYRVFDKSWVSIKGFFFVHEDLSRSLIYENPVIEILDRYGRVESKNLHFVLFNDGTIDFRSNLYLSMHYLTEEEYYKLQEVHLHVPDSTRTIELVYDEQESYDGQHAEEVPLWLESDLVPNPR